MLWCKGMFCSSCWLAVECPELPVPSPAGTWFMAYWLVGAGCLLLLGQNQLCSDFRQEDCDMQHLNLASFCSSTASFGAFAATLDRKGYLTQLEKASEAGDFSSISQPDVCWWRVCQGEAQEMLCWGSESFTDERLWAAVSFRASCLLWHSLLALLWGVCYSLTNWPQFLNYGQLKLHC